MIYPGAAYREGWLYKTPAGRLIFYRLARPINNRAQMEAVVRFKGKMILRPRPSLNELRVSSTRFAAIFKVVFGGPWRVARRGCWLWDSFCENLGWQGWGGG